jgi:hypothetical protein
MSDRAPSPPYQGLLRTLQFDLQAMTVTLETVDRATITLQLTEAGVVTSVQAAAPTEDAVFPASDPSADQTSAGKILATITGKLKSRPRQGRPDANGNPTAWAKLAAHEDGLVEARMYSATFHRHTAALALSLDKDTTVTVRGYVRRSSDPGRMDGLSVFGIVHYPGKQAE